MTLSEAILLRAGWTPAQLNLDPADVEPAAPEALIRKDTIDRHPGRTMTDESKRAYSRRYYWEKVKPARLKRAAAK